MRYLRCLALPGLLLLMSVSGCGPSYPTPSTHFPTDKKMEQAPDMRVPPGPSNK